MMLSFNILFFKVLSILFSVIIGFLAGKYAYVERESIAKLLFYFIAPIVFFSAPANAPFSWGILSIGVVTFLISCLASLTMFLLHKSYTKEEGFAEIMALSAGTSNTGYFMLPIASAIFDEITLAIYTMLVIGINLFESSVGFYISSRSSHNMKDAFMKMIKLPTLNAFIAGIIFSFMGFNLPDFLDDFVLNMRGAYSVLGMTMIGLGLAGIKNFELDWKFVGVACAQKHLLYPVLILLFVMLDKYFFT